MAVQSSPGCRGPGTNVDPEDRCLDHCMTISIGRCEYRIECVQDQECTSNGDSPCLAIVSTFLESE